MDHQNQGTNGSIGTVAELNVTPLLDLAFVLLIIFMITAPFLAESADLVIPSSKASRDAVDPTSVFTVSIDKHGALDLNGEPIAREELRFSLEALRGKNPGMGVVVRAHSFLPVQDLVSIMDILREAQISQVGVVTKPDSD